MMSQGEFDAWVNNMLRIRITQHGKKNGQDDDDCNTWTIIANQIKLAQVANFLGDKQLLLPERSLERANENYPQEIEFLNKIDAWKQQGKSEFLIQQLGKQWHEANPVK